MIDAWLPLLLPIVQIIWINILLSGDNAVVIALACRSLPDHQRNIGVALGAGAAILLRIIFTLFTAYLIGLPWLKALGALALLWIAVKLIVPDEEDEDSITGHSSLWKAVKTIAIADVVMSLDNVIAIAAVANGNIGLIVFGLMVSIPLVIAGSTLLLKVINRYPILVWAGAGLLGWLAGEILAEDPGLIQALGSHLPVLPMQIIGLLLVLGLGFLFKTRQSNAKAKPQV